MIHTLHTTTNSLDVGRRGEQAEAYPPENLAVTRAGRWNAVAIGLRMDRSIMTAVVLWWLKDQTCVACSCKKGPFQKQLLLCVDWGEVVGKDLWPKVVRVLVLAAAPRSRSWQAIVTDEKV